MKTDPMDSKPAPGPQATPVVLVVDDEPDVRGLVREVLRTAGFAPLTASHGEDALAILQHLSGRVDLVLTDVMMPVLDGPTLARRLSREWPGVPVLFITGYPADTLEALGYLPRTVPRIEKPFSIRDLVARVRGALGLEPAAGQ